MGRAKQGNPNPNPPDEIQVLKCSQVFFVFFQTLLAEQLQV